MSRIVTIEDMNGDHWTGREVDDIGGEVADIFVSIFTVGVYGAVSGEQATVEVNDEQRRGSVVEVIRRD